MTRYVSRFSVKTSRALRGSRSAIKKFIVLMVVMLVLSHLVILFNLLSLFRS